jgi:hypothetical protein
VPTPRITIALLALVVPLRKVTEGTTVEIFSRLMTPAWIRRSPETAVIAIGTSWTFSSTFWAVTMISSTCAIAGAVCISASELAEMASALSAIRVVADIVFLSPAS